MCPKQHGVVCAWLDHATHFEYQRPACICAHTGAVGMCIRQGELQLRGAEVSMRPLQSQLFGFRQSHIHNGLVARLRRR